jgi:hypothetical protein
LGILELLVEASYSSKEQKSQLLRQANREIAVMRWLVRMAKDRNVLTFKQYEYFSGCLYETGSMLGGWLKSSERS